MAILRCPHCESVSIVTGGKTIDDVCLNRNCRGIMERLEPQAVATAIFAACCMHNRATADEPKTHALAEF